MAEQLRVGILQVGETEYNGLRLRFRASRGKTVDQSRLDVWGLDVDAAGALSKPGTRVQIIAGLLGQEGVVIHGTVSRDSLTRDVLTSLTSVGITESGSALRDVRFSACWPGPVRASELLTHVADRVAAGRIVQDLPRDPSYARGYALIGTGRDLLRTLAADCGCTWGIQAGMVVLIPLDGAARGRVRVWGPETGLLGYPMAADKGRVRARVILAPGIMPGDRYELQGAEHAGSYIAERVDHDGDTHGAAWDTLITGRRA